MPFSSSKTGTGTFQHFQAHKAYVFDLKQFLKIQIHMYLLQFKSFNITGTEGGKKWSMSPPK